MLRWPDATVYGGLSDVAERDPESTAVIYTRTQFDEHANLDLGSNTD